MYRILKPGFALLMALCVYVAFFAPVAHAGAYTDCLVVGNGYCGGPANEYPRPASWHGRFVVVRQGNQARHVRMYFGIPQAHTPWYRERAFVGRIVARCTPRGAKVVSTHAGVAYVRMCGRMYAHRFRAPNAPPPIV